MSEPLSYAKFIGALRGAGLQVVEVETGGKPPSAHDRDHTGSWGPVNGVMIHHTVTEGTARTVEICRAGYPGLPGPLCHGVIAKSGWIYVVGYGRTNHAGLGDRDVLNAVRAESYATRPPVPDKDNLIDFNRHFYGFECENLGDGKDGWPDAQLDAIERASAALCKAHGWNEKSVIGHLEAQPGKVDPRGFTMPAMRTRIKKRLTAPAQPKPPALSRDESQDRRISQLERDVAALAKKS